MAHKAETDSRFFNLKSGIFIVNYPLQIVIDSKDRFTRRQEKGLTKQFSASKIGAAEQDPSAVSDSGGRLGSIVLSQPEMIITLDKPNIRNYRRNFVCRLKVKLLKSN